MKKLKHSIKDLESIYEQFILGQSIVIIVSSLEVFREEYKNAEKDSNTYVMASNIYGCKG